MLHLIKVLLWFLWRIYPICPGLGLFWVNLDCFDCFPFSGGCCDPGWAVARRRGEKRVGGEGGRGGTEGQGGSLGGRMIWYRRIATGTLVTNGPPDLYGSH